MYGNLKAFGGHDAYNEYAEHLRTLGEPMLPHSGLLWVLRVVLLVSLVVHVYCAVDAVAPGAEGPRGSKYVVKKNKHSTLASHLMRWGGLTLLVFIVWHLLNFTIGKVNVPGGPTNDPYNLLVDSFSVWWLTLIYLVAMAMLGAHLHHGVWSSMQTLGLTNTARSRARAKQCRPRRRRRHRRRLLARPDLRPARRHLQVRGPLTHDRHARHHAPPPRTPSTTGQRRSRPTTPPATTSPASRSRTPRPPAARSRRSWDTRQFEARIVNPANRRKALGDRGRHRPGRRLGRRHAGRGRLLR